MEINKQNPRAAADSGTPDRGTAKKKRNANTPAGIREEKRQGAKKWTKTKEKTLKADQRQRRKKRNDKQELKPRRPSCTQRLQRIPGPKEKEEEEEEAEGKE